MRPVTVKYGRRDRMFQHLLREETVKLHLEAPNREAALAELIAVLPSWAVPPRQKGNLLELLLQRENFGTTAIGEGVALPHCVFPSIGKSIAALGISRRGISYPSLDGKPVQLIFLTAFPDTPHASEERRLLLHEAENFFRDSFLRERLKICETAEEAYEVLVRESPYTAEDAPGLPGVSGAVPARGVADVPRAGGRAKRGPLTAHPLRSAGLR